MEEIDPKKVCVWVRREREEGRDSAEEKTGDVVKSTVVFLCCNVTVDKKSHTPVTVTAGGWRNTITHINAVTL